ncbi:MAG: ribosome maturation factor RimP [Pseudomonadota bacterium]
MITDTLETLLEPEVVRLGYELVDVEYQSAGGSSVLRVFIDGPDGISVDDCAIVSDGVSGILDVEDPIPGEYNLEISSPGLDRPLKRPEHYEKYAGELIKVKMLKGFVGRKRLKGVLTSLVDGTVALDVDGKPVEVPLNQIESARLVPVVDFSAKR